MLFVIKPKIQVTPSRHKNDIDARSPRITFFRILISSLAFKVDFRRLRTTNTATMMRTKTSKLKRMMASTGATNDQIVAWCNQQLELFP